jgi:release factor glutamine methyltransferase
MTWGEALATTERFLADAGIEEARLEAALLLGHIVGASRTLVRLHTDRELGGAEADWLQTLVERRSQREPLPYVLGEQQFMGLGFAVDRRALIPRWDTECLVERCVARLERAAEPVWVADVGTGSGAIAVSLAHLLPEARVWAVELDPDTLALARSNGQRNGVDDRLTWLQGDLGEPLLAAGLAGRLAAVVANLPYIPTGDIAGLAPEVRDHEPRAALDGGADGLDLLRRFAPQAEALAREGGLVVLECGDHQATAVRRLYEEATALEWLEVVRDLGGRERGVVLEKV